MARTTRSTTAITRKRPLTAEYQALTLLDETREGLDIKDEDGDGDSSDDSDLSIVICPPALSAGYLRD